MSIVATVAHLSYCRALVRTVVQQLTRLQLTYGASRGLSAIVESVVTNCICLLTFQFCYKMAVSWSVFQL